MPVRKDRPYDDQPARFIGNVHKDHGTIARLRIFIAELKSFGSCPMSLKCFKTVSEMRTVRDVTPSPSSARANFLCPARRAEPRHRIGQDPGVVFLQQIKRTYRDKQRQRGIKPARNTMTAVFAFVCERRLASAFACIFRISARSLRSLSSSGTNGNGEKTRKAGSASPINGQATDNNSPSLPKARYSCASFHAEETPHRSLRPLLRPKTAQPPQKRAVLINQIVPREHQIGGRFPVPASLYT